MEKILEKEFRKEALNTLLECGFDKETAIATISKQFKAKLIEGVQKKFEQVSNELVSGNFDALENENFDFKEYTGISTIAEIAAQLKKL